MCVCVHVHVHNMNMYNYRGFDLLYSSTNTKLPRQAWCTHNALTAHSLAGALTCTPRRADYTHTHTHLLDSCRARGRGSSVALGRLTTSTGDHGGSSNRVRIVVLVCLPDNHLAACGLPAPLRCLPDGRGR